tara:strand:- start:418 stop:597 length:180 start_codon:yes stop_codon:yes gene_type:complete
MTEIINIGDKLNLGIIKTISREIRDIKNRLQILEDNDSEILRNDLNKVVKEIKEDNANN